MPKLWIGYKNECWETTTIDYYKTSLATFIQSQFEADWDETIYEIGYYHVQAQNLTGYFLQRNSNGVLVAYTNTSANSVLNPLFPSSVDATWNLFYTLGIPFISDQGVPIRFP